MSRSVSRLPLLIRTRSTVAFRSLANATTKAAAAAAAFLSELASSRLLLFVRHTEEVSVLLEVRHTKDRGNSWRTSRPEPVPRNDHRRHERHQFELLLGELENSDYSARTRTNTKL